MRDKLEVLRTVYGYGSFREGQEAAVDAVRAAYLNSSLTPRQFDLALENARRGVYKIIYVSPERLETPRFLSFARNANIALVAVDEAHCVSQWGQDFRPGYLKIPAFLEELDRRPAVGGLHRHRHAGGPAGYCGQAEASESGGAGLRL